MINHSAFLTRDCTAQSIPPTEQRVSVLRQGRRNVIKSCPDVFSRRRIRHVLKHDRMQKDRLYLKRYIHFLKPKRSWSLNLNCSEGQRGKTWIYCPLSVHMMFLVHSMPISMWNWLIVRCIFSIQNGPFQKKSYQWPHLCITTFPHSLWCRDACSVYNITTRKCRVSVNSLSLFVVRLQKGLTKQPQLFVFSWSSLHLGKHNLQIVNV